MNRDMTVLLLVVIALVCIGTVTVYSVCAVKQGGDRVLRQHLLSIVVGFAGMYVAWRIDYHIFHQRYVVRGIAVLTIALLIYVFVFGEEIRGAKRWIRILGFQFQPSEFAKLAVVVFLAHKLADNQALVKTFLYGFVPPLATALWFAGLIVIEPDLGIPAVIVTAAFVMMFVAGVRVRYVVGSVAPVIAAITILVLKYPYRLRRVIAWLRPFDFSQTEGFHLIQSLAAFARGSYYGLGPGASEQKLLYLPDAHTDFIFAVWGEEMGLRGTLLMVLLFIVLVTVAIRIVMCAPDLFGTLLAVGIVSLIGLQAMLNMSVATGLLPTKGLPLPFVSYGGTATAMFLTVTGILLNIGRQGEEREGKMSPAFAR